MTLLVDRPRTFGSSSECRPSDFVPSIAMRDFLENKQEGKKPGSGLEQRWVCRDDAALSAVERLLARAEEAFPADTGMSLGTWFARVQETIAVTARVLLNHLESGRLLDQDVRPELMVAFGDVCAESTRALAWLGGGDPARANQATLHFLREFGGTVEECDWLRLQETVARCCAMLEPVATVLRNGDLPLGDARDREGAEVEDALLKVARESFGQVCALCG